MSKEKKKKEGSNSKVPIVYKGSWLEKFSPTNPDKPTLDQAFKRNGWKPPRIRWWIGRARDEAVKEAEAYQNSRQEIIDEHAKKHKSDGTLTTLRGEEIEYKKGDIVITPGGQIEWIDSKHAKIVEEELNDLREGEIPIRFWKIVIEDEDDMDKEISPYELSLLFPILECPSLDEHSEFMMSEEEFGSYKESRDNGSKSEELESTPAETTE